MTEGELLPFNITGHEEKSEKENQINEQEPSTWTSMQKTFQKEDIKSSKSQVLWIQETEHQLGFK